MKEKFKIDETNNKIMTKDGVFELPEGEYSKSDNLTGKIITKHKTKQSYTLTWDNTFIATKDGDVFTFEMKMVGEPINASHCQEIANIYGEATNRIAELLNDI